MSNNEFRVFCEHPENRAVLVYATHAPSRRSALDRVRRHTSPLGIEIFADEASAESICNQKYTGVICYLYDSPLFQRIWGSRANAVSYLKGKHSPVKNKEGGSYE